VGINPPSDIVLGSMLAADPDKYRVAVARLRQFALPPSRATAAAEAPPTFALRATVSSAHRSAASDAFGQLEAFVLQTFIQNMLPSNAEAAFGKGTAGEVWKSMLAEQLANQMALSGQVGLARRLAEGIEGRTAFPGGGAAPVPPVPPRAAGALLEALPYLHTGVKDATTSEETSSVP
jgi:peptidoglycan hydrolase FlgJ